MTLDVCNRSALGEFQISALGERARSAPSSIAIATNNWFAGAINYSTVYERWDNPFGTQTAQRITSGGGFYSLIGLQKDSSGARYNRRRGMRAGAFQSLVNPSVSVPISIKFSVFIQFFFQVTPTLNIYAVNTDGNPNTFANYTDLSHQLASISALSLSQNAVNVINLNVAVYLANMTTPNAKLLITTNNDAISSNPFGASPNGYSEFLGISDSINGSTINEKVVFNY